jgi:hypothetical protein
VPSKPQKTAWPWTFTDDATREFMAKQFSAALLDCKWHVEILSGSHMPIFNSLTVASQFVHIE